MFNRFSFIDVKYQNPMQTTFLVVPKSVRKWFISMIPLSGISVRVKYMHTKMRKIIERFLTGANVNWTSEIKHKVNILVVICDSTNCYVHKRRFVHCVDM
jgi:uncharacterized protein YqfA (UPF0365 family)